jgi:anti-sigma regulatory factor (Ser/Thr protein kinase)
VNPPRIELHVPGTRAGFERAFTALQATLAELAVDTRRRFQLEFVFEEIILNVVMHAAPIRPDVAIDVAIEIGDEEARMTFEDDGPAFDPCAEPEPARPASLAEAPIGGLGLVAVRRMAYGMSYERTAAGRNCLRVTLSRSPAA